MIAEVTHWLTIRFAPWQTLIAGILALAAAWWTVRATRSTANNQIEAAHKQTSVTAEQTATIVRLERERHENEARAFCVMLEAAMARVLAETAGTRKTYSGLIEHPSGDPSRQAFEVRTCITKGAFAELRAACVRLGSPLTGEFLDLEREIDSFASQWEERGSFSTGMPPVIRVGRHPGLGDQLAVIETKATELRKKAAKGIG